MAHSPNGWTDSELGYEWLVKDFDAQTKDKAGGRTRVVLMDGHSSHYSLDLLEYARKNNIVILGYPPHCTHVLQGLHVVCFAKMKTEFRAEIRAFEDSHMRGVGKGDFAGVFGRAYLHAFTPESVKVAFAATGVHPYNPDVITEKQMQPSLPTSTRGSFPLTQSSPVRAIVHAMGSHPPTSFELSPTHHGPASHSFQSPSSPSGSGSRLHDENNDSEPETPSKRLHIMYSNLGATTSGSMLVSKNRISSAYTVAVPVFEDVALLPEPNWDLLNKRYDAKYQSRDSVLQQNAALTESLAQSKDIIHTLQLKEERANAQLVVQNAHPNKLNQVLHTKENKKKSDRTVLFAEGFGRHLTNDESIALVQGQKERREMEAEELEQRQVARVDRKAARAALEEEWKEIVRKHTEAVLEWNSECEKLRADGVRAKNLPKKPKRAPKPKLPIEEPQDDEEEAQMSSSGSDGE